MRIGIGLPAGIPGAPAPATGAWAESAMTSTERKPCASADSGAAGSAGHHLAHYCTDASRDAVLADALTDVDRPGDELARLRATGCDDLLLLPCDPDPGQVDRLAAALAALGAPLRAEGVPA
jgi:hypothetical protein